MAILTKAILNSITNALYASATVAFFKVTPGSGEVEIVTITEGFTFVRERKAGQEIDGSGVKVWLANDAAITREQLRIAGAVALTVDGITTRYRIADLLPMQQIGAGYTLRLEPQKGATG